MIKEYIAGDNKLLIVFIEPDMSGRMTRQEQHVKRGVSEFEILPLLQFAVRQYFTVAGEPIVGRICFYCSQYWQFDGVDGKGHFVPALDEIVSQHMIDVAMGVD